MIKPHCFWPVFFFSRLYVSCSLNPRCLPRVILSYLHAHVRVSPGFDLAVYDRFFSVSSGFTRKAIENLWTDPVATEGWTILA